MTSTDQKCCVEYIWLDSENNLRSKTRVIDQNHLKSLPDWNYDGSSTNQAKGRNTEIKIKPRLTVKNPLLDYSHSYLTICETFDHNDQPLSNNHREKANKLFSQLESQEPWFGLEQEYFIIDRKTNLPLGFPLAGHGVPLPQGPYYCSYRNSQIAREIAEKHLVACLQADLKISGINAEVAPGQWEFQIGPCVGIEAGDHMYLARYLLEAIVSRYNCEVNYEPKPLTGDWNGSGCHVNFSTREMREPGGLKLINDAMVSLEQRHSEHMTIYGIGNERRLTGAHETAPFNKFSWGIGTRCTSVRIGHETQEQGYGYFEDRRPASNIDPYIVTAKIFATVNKLDY